MKNTLIIGGNGYIGSLLYEKLSKNFLLSVDSVDLCLFGKDLGFSIKENYNYFDISKYKNIVLLAGHSSVPMCEYDKKKSWVNNVDYFYNICENLSKEQTLIYASSASVYGKNSSVSYEKDVNLSPINHYDLTKISIDIIANKFINEGKTIIGLRFGTVNGKSLNTRSDLMINSMILSYKKTGYIKVKNTQVRRAILGIHDLTDGIISILKSQIKTSGQYNMGSFNSTVDEIYRNVVSMTGCRVEMMEDDLKQYDFEICSKKFEDTFNFQFKQNCESIINDLLNADYTSSSSRDDNYNINLF